MRHTALVATLSLFATAALAQERPSLLPSRDVQVVYKTLGHNAGHELTFSQAANNPRIRVEGAQIPGYAVIDRALHATMVVMPAQKMVIDIAADRPSGQDFVLPDAQGRFTRKGQDKVAGLPCIVWEFDTGRETGTACVATDGVMLRTVNRSGDGLEATKLAYMPQPLALFAAPPGYQKMTYPSGYAGAVRPGAATPSSLPPAAASTYATPAPASPYATPAAPPAYSNPSAAAATPTLPPNVAAALAARGINLPPGFQIPPGFKLPPGFQLPPGVKLPPGVTLPQ